MNNQFRDNIAELIKAYFSDDGNIPKKTRDRLERLIEADRVQKDSNLPTRHSKIQFLKTKFAISLEQARLDIVSASQLFNEIDTINLATGYRLLLNKAEAYEQLCWHSNNVEMGFRYLELIRKIYQDLKECVDDMPKTFDSPAIFFLSGDLAKKNLDLPVYDKEKVKQLIQGFKIEEKEKERLINEIGE